VAGLVLGCAACGDGASTTGTVAGEGASCVAPYLDSVPPDATSVAAAHPVRPGASVTVYGHWYTSTCNDTNHSHDPLRPLRPVHLTAIWPNGEVQRLGTFTPAGRDMGFSVVVHVPREARPGTARIRDDQAHPSTYRFHVG
jgi:hypothetical protein